MTLPLANDAAGARVVNGLSITPGMPAFLGVSPVLGRAFTHEDAAPGAPTVAMLSYNTWRREYGGAADVLGRVITLDGVVHVVVGVMPARADRSCLSCVSMCGSRYTSTRSLGASRVG